MSNMNVIDGRRSVDFDAYGWIWRFGSWDGMDVQKQNVTR